MSKDFGNLKYILTSPAPIFVQPSTTNEIYIFLPKFVGIASAILTKFRNQARNNYNSLKIIVLVNHFRNIKVDSGKILYVIIHRFQLVILLICSFKEEAI